MIYFYQVAQIWINKFQKYATDFFIINFLAHLSQRLIDELIA